MAPKNQRWWLTADSVELEIEADADTLYRMVSDLPRIGEWSPECERVTWEGDVTTPVEGTTFVGHNAVGPGRRIRYSRHGTVLRAEPGRAFSFITDEGGRPSTAWHYTFEPLGEAGPGSPRATRSAGSRPGPASSTCPSTATRSFSRGCGPHSSASGPPPRPARRPGVTTTAFTATPGVEVMDGYLTSSG